MDGKFHLAILAHMGSINNNDIKSHWQAGEAGDQTCDSWQAGEGGDWSLIPDRLEKPGIKSVIPDRLEKPGIESVIPDRLEKLGIEPVIPKTLNCCRVSIWPMVLIGHQTHTHNYNICSSAGSIMTTQG